jgi:hypothetical protein
MNFIAKKLSWREIDSSHRLMLLIVATLGLFNFFFGEIVPVNDGFGWDGATYARMTRELWSMISEGQLSFYYAQRILPCAIVRGLLLLVGAPFSANNIIRGFELYNLVLLFTSCWLWKRLADNFSISLVGRWLGFSGLFLSFMASKQVFFYPVLTDVTAFFVGMLLLLFYVEKRPLALLATTITGALAWQVVGICGAMLIFFLRHDLTSEAIEPAPSRLWLNPDTHSRRIIRGWAILLIVTIASVSDYLNGSGAMPAWKDLRSVRWLMESHAPLEKLFTGLPSVAGVAIALVMLIGSGLLSRSLYTDSWKNRLPLVLLAIAAVLIPRTIVGVISNPAVKNVSGLSTIVSVTFLPPNGKFFLPLVTLTVYWGPVVMLLLLKWKDFCIEARKLGPGFMAVVALSLPLGLCTEPRFITCAWPFFVLGAVLVMERTAVGARFKLVFSVLTLFFSQFWLPINSAPWSTDYYGGYNSLYFMHQGMFMIMDAIPYTIYVVFIGATFLWLRAAMLVAKPVNG